MSAKPAELSVMRRLWVTMAEIYGHRWVSAYGEDAGAGAGLTWARGLAGLTPAQVGRGLEQALLSADPWPPTLPQFRAMCLGIPSLAEVKADIRRPSHERQPFTRMVWGHLDAFGFSRADQDRSDRMLRDAYEQAREAVMRGESMPEPVAGVIEAPKPEPRVPAPREVAEKHIEELARRFHGDDEGHIEAEPPRGIA